MLGGCRFVLFFCWWARVFLIFFVVDCSLEFGFALVFFALVLILVAFVRGKYRLRS